MAERQGFEPWAGFYPDSRLAGGRLKPLGHLSEVKVWFGALGEIRTLTPFGNYF